MLKIPVSSADLIHTVPGGSFLVDSTNDFNGEEHLKSMIGLDCWIEMLSCWIEMLSLDCCKNSNSDLIDLFVVVSWKMHASHEVLDKTKHDTRNHLAVTGQDPLALY